MYGLQSRTSIDYSKLLKKKEVTQMSALIYHQAFQGPFLTLPCSAGTYQMAFM